MSTLKGKLEQENEEKYIGKTTEAYVMNENWTKAQARCLFIQVHILLISSTSMLLAYGVKPI
jgi:hypothetical protein